METSAWCLMEAVSGQTGITVSCMQQVIQVHLEKNTIRIIMTRMYNFFQSLNVIVKIMIIIHTFLVVFHGNKIYQMKEKVICYIMISGCFGLFCSLKILRFF